MKTAWRVVFIIVLIAIVIGAVCAGIGILTGADAAHIQTVLENRIAEKYNVDAEAVVTEWIPEVVQSIQEGVTY